MCKSPVLQSFRMLNKVPRTRTWHMAVLCDPVRVRQAYRAVAVRQLCRHRLHERAGDRKNLVDTAPDPKRLDKYDVRGGAIGKQRGRRIVVKGEGSNGSAKTDRRGGKSGHQAMWLWIWALPVWWLFGFPFGGAFFLLSAASLPLFVAMVVILAGMGLMARAALNY